MPKSSLWKVACVVSVFWIASVITSSAQTLTTLASFAMSNGAEPTAALIQASDGNFYGTTYYGGISEPDYGTVFKMTPGGTLTALHIFCSQSYCDDGLEPHGGLVQGADGNFYGTASAGGYHSVNGDVFKITPGGTLTVLHTFQGTDGEAPMAGLVLANDGNFYGTTQYGGAGCTGSGGCGTVFKITPDGTLTTLHSFNNADGAYSVAPLVQARDGNFYGTTQYGGANENCYDQGVRAGCGTVFKITPDGTLTTLYSFCSQSNCTDGYEPYAGLVQGSDGNFYGTTYLGGAHSYGEVFRITPNGSLTVLYSFCSQSGCTDGDYPFAGLIQATDGNFYGATYSGGTNGQGTLFQITSAGALTTLYSFCLQSGCADGANPYGGLMQAANHDFYGTTYSGGANNEGTVFKLEANFSTLTVSVAGSGSVTSTDGNINCPGTCSHLYSNNTPVTLNATAASGWSFSAWSGACSGNNPTCNLTITQNESVGATFTQNTYTLSVSTTGNGTVTSTDGNINCPGTCSHLYLSNTVVNLTANPAQGWSLSSWGGACSGSNSTCAVTMTGNESVSATFTQNYYTLTVTISGQGTVTSTDGNINCPGSCSHTYISLTNVTLNATAAQGWNFQGWSGSCTGVGACNLEMLGNYGVSAYFLQPGNGLRMTPVMPCRLVDTRPQNGGGGPIQGGTSQTFNLPQQAQQKGCANLSTASAYSLNVTLVPVSGAPVYYLTIWPAGMAQPLISTMNSLDGRIKANAAIVPAGTSSSVSVFVSNTTNVVLDIDGYYGPSSSSTLQFYPLPPCRVLDTRNADGPLGGPYLQTGVKRDFPVLQATACNIPNTALAYSMNFTVAPYDNQILGYLTVWPTGGSQPVVSTLNNLTATYVANAAIVPAGTDGQISVYPSGNTHLVGDINGYFAAPGTGGQSLYPTAPCRVIDTRHGGGSFSGELTVNVAGSPCAPPGNTQAYVFNATVVPVGDLGYLTLWPDTEGRPLASTLNAMDGAITSNMAIVPNLNGETDAYAAGTTQLILDISSYFAP